jgi:hypothetical protein
VGGEFGDLVVELSGQGCAGGRRPGEEFAVEAKHPADQRDGPMRWWGVQDGAECFLKSLQVALIEQRGG